MDRQTSVNPETAQTSLEVIPDFAEVFVTPIREKLIDEDGSLGAIRHGANIAALVGGTALYVKDVWQRGAYLPWRPFYERRLDRAVGKAAKLLGVLAVDREVQVPKYRERKKD